MTGNQAAKTRRIKKLAYQLVRHHFPRKKISIKQLGGGITNFVFGVSAGKEELVVRISDQPGKINYFLKEQWAVERARKKKIPVPEILEVGNTVIALPYMISDKVKGIIALDHPKRKDVLYQMGKMAALIHEIGTTGYGQFFDWSSNTLSKNITWKDFLDGELDSKGRMTLLKKNRMLSTATFQNMNAELKKMRSVKSNPCLQHGDLRLKNIMVGDDGKITAIIDWEECISAVGPAWDLSIALHDLPIEGQQRFLEGYGMKSSEIIKIKKSLATFNLLNYAPVIQKLVQEKNTGQLDWYRARLHGTLDLYSV